jgi:hypothetical protein
LAKSPSGRYAHARDLATAFRLALAAPPIELQQPQKELPVSSDITPADLYPPYSLFDPALRTDFIQVDNSELTSSQSSPVLPAAVLANVRKPLLPLVQESEAKNTLPTIFAVHPDPIIQVQDPPVLSEKATDHSVMLAAPGIEQDAPLLTERTTYHTNVFAITGTERRTTGDIIKLTSPAKIVNVPVTGQPGRYFIGLLPAPPTPQPEGQELIGGTSAKHGLQKRFKIIGVVMLVLLVLSTGTLWFGHQLSNSKTPAAVTIVKTPDVRATMTTQAEATADANIILSDSLAQNIHDWPTNSNGSMIYSFEDEAYHIIDNDNSLAAPAILPNVILKGPFAYTLTMEEIKGDDTSINNEFGMILRASIQNKNGKTTTTFYSFEVLNKAGGEYQFWKYDDSQGSSFNPWKQLGNHPFRNEFHEGQGPKSINTFKIIANGENFTLLVNGKQVWTVQDSSFASGGIGMLVNLKGTEVAFSNLILTYK